MVGWLVGIQAPARSSLVALASEDRLELSDLRPEKQIGGCSLSNLSGLENQMEGMGHVATERKKYA